MFRKRVHTRRHEHEQDDDTLMARWFVPLPRVGRGLVAICLQNPSAGAAASGTIWKFDTLCEHPLGKGEATCHSSWLYSFIYRRYVEGYYKSSSRHGMVENTLLVAEGIFAL